MTRRSFAERLRRRLDAQVSGPLEARLIAPLRRRVNAGRSYDPVFVAGASGSGTSFLALSLGQCFDFASVIYESNFQIGPDSLLYVPDISAFDTVAEYQQAIGPHPSWSLETAREDMLRMYRSFSWGRSGAVVDKGPDTNLLRAGFLARCFPGARFLLIYRDPVANIEGLRRKWRTFGANPLEDTIRFYRETHERFMTAAGGFPEQVSLIDYDALTTRYDEILAAIGERLGLPAATRRRRLPTRDNVEGMGIRNVQQNRIGIVKDANRRAIERLAPGEADTIHRALGPLHDRLCTSPLNVEVDRPGARDDGVSLEQS